MFSPSWQSIKSSNSLCFPHPQQELIQQQQQTNKTHQQKHTTITTTTTATIFPLLLVSSHNSKREKSPNLLLQNLWTCWRSSSLFLSILFGFFCLVSSFSSFPHYPLSSLAPSFPLPSLHVTTTYVQSVFISCHFMIHGCLCGVSWEGKKGI